MRYKIGMRAWLDVVADKSLPSLVSDAEGEVAAEFKVSTEFYRGMAEIQPWARRPDITKVPSEMVRLAAGKRLKFQVALLQIAPNGNHRSQNLAKGLNFCRKAKAIGADLAVFPELWSMGGPPAAP